MPLDLFINVINITKPIVYIFIRHSYLCWLAKSIHSFSPTTMTLLISSSFIRIPRFFVNWIFYMKLQQGMKHLVYVGCIHHRAIIPSDIKHEVIPVRYNFCRSSYRKFLRWCGLWQRSYVFQSMLKADFLLVFFPSLSSKTSITNFYISKACMFMQFSRTGF